jgi:hypothetical protein
MARVGNADIRWIDQRRNTRAGPFVVGTLVPDEFAACLRVLHPAQRSGNGLVQDVRWQDIAMSNGRTLSSLSHYEDISPPGSLSDLDLAKPLQGQLADRLCEELAATLSRHTHTPADCIFMFSSSWGSLLPSNAELTRVQLYEGDYVVTTGRCAEACDFAVNPTMWWPSDRSWIVVTQVDMDSSFIGCDYVTMKALLESPNIEAWQVSREAPV